MHDVSVKQLTYVEHVEAGECVVIADTGEPFIIEEFRSCVEVGDKRLSTT